MIDGVLLNPTRSALLDVLAAMGSRTSMLRVEESHGELVGTISLMPGQGRHVLIEGSLTALLIDELPVIAAIAPFTSGGIEVRDAGELRVKESDRLGAVTRNLQAMGAQVEQTESGWRIPGGQDCTALRSRATTTIESRWRLRWLRSRQKARASFTTLSAWRFRILRSSRTWRKLWSGRADPD